MAGQAGRLLILATGAGSLTRVPALLLEGTTVVSFAAIALMKDQLEHRCANAASPDVVALNSTLSEEQEVRARARIASGSIRIACTLKIAASRALAVDLILFLWLR